MRTPTPMTVAVLPIPGRLESWKEIAAYLRRSERTVRRWERSEGLPVHRLQHDQRGSVFAYAHELDAWRDSRRDVAEAPRSETEPTESSAAPRARFIRVSSAIVLAVGVLGAAAVWHSSRRPAVAGYTPHPEAVFLVNRVSFAANAGRTQLEAAVRTYREALRIDPRYGPAWDGLAHVHVAQMWFGETPVTENATQARQEAQEALRIDPSLAGPFSVLGFINHYVDYDHKTAEAHFRKSIAINPKAAASLSWFGDFWASQRQFDQARHYYRLAQQAGPRWLEPITFAANLHSFAGHPQQAIAEHLRVLEVEPGYGLGNHYLGLALVAAGQHEAGVARLRKSDELLGQVPFSRADFGYGLARAGRRDEAARMLDEMMRRRAESYYPAFAVAMIHLGLGHSDAALDWLEKAVDERHVGFYLPAVGPFYDLLRDEPRFQRILERLNIHL